MNFEAIPNELKKLDNWVLWHKYEKDKITREYITKDVTPTKVPYQISGWGASSTNPKTWTTFDKATKFYYDHKDEYSGIGFEFCNSGYTGIDIDHIGEENEISTEEAQSIIADLESYTETSQSGKGIHVIVRGSIPQDFKHVIEMYSNTHYFALTGDIVDGKKDIEDRQPQIDALYEKYHVEKTPNVVESITPKELDCAYLLDKAFQSKNGFKIEALYNNPWTELLTEKGEPYESESDVDLALCNHLAFWFDKDFNTIDKMFMNSPHYKRKDQYHIDKWDRPDYKALTIDKAIKDCNKSYQELIEEQNKFEKIIPFDEYIIPEFPSECFPDWIKNYIDAVAENTQTPKDLASVIGLSVFAAALAGEVKIQGKIDWEEPLNLYTAVIMNPAERKSSVFTHMTKPLQEYEAETNLKLKSEIAVNRVEKEILENALKNLKTAASKKNELIESVKDKAIELDSFVDIKPLRILADDVSPEKVTGLLAENKGKMAIMSPEGGIFGIMAGRYSSNGSGNFDVFLKAHNGDTLRVDRVGRAPELVYNPALTMGLTIQPEVLKGVMGNTDFTGRGLSARFLFSFPKSKVGSRNIKSKTIPTEYRDSYFRNVKTLLNTKQVQCDFLTDEEDKIHILHLSKEATEKSFKFAEELEPRLIDDLEYIKEWAGKLHGAVLRIAGILHCCTYIGINYWDVDVSEETLNEAITIGYYFIEHYKIIAGLMGLDPNIEKAKFILKYIKKNVLTEFTKRDIQRGNRTRFKNVESMEPALKILIENNYIIENQTLVTYIGFGRKPVSKYRVNPLYK